MKYLYLLLLSFCCVSLSAQAQLVVWSPPGAEWHYPAGTFAEAGYLHTWYQADTIIDSRPCKLFRNHRKVGNYVTGQVTDQYWNDYTYEQAGIVFYYAHNFNTSVSSWDTLYNFNALPGQSWRFEGWGTGEWVEVQDTGQTVLNGHSVRWYTARYFMNSTPHPFLLDTVYERIGATKIYPLSPAILITEPDVHALCNYSDNSFPDWPKPDAACRILATSREDDIPPLQFTAYPNPATSTVVVELTEAATPAGSRLQLHNLLGRQVLEQRFTGTSLSIDLGAVPAGLYLLSLTNAHGQRWQQKLVVEHR